MQKGTAVEKAMQGLGLQRELTLMPKATSCAVSTVGCKPSFEQDTHDVVPVALEEAGRMVLIRHDTNDAAMKGTYSIAVSKVLCMPGLTLISQRKRPTPTSPH